MAAAPDVLIVGGGIWGASTAFHLARSRRCKVCVVERNFDIAQETTCNAAGMVGQIRSSRVLTRAIGYALELFERFPSEFGHDPGLVRCGSLFIGLTPERVEYFHRQVKRGVDNGLSIDSVEVKEIDHYLAGLNLSKILGSYFVHGDGYLDPVKAARSMASAAMNLGADFRFGFRVTGIRVEEDRATGVETPAGFLPAGKVVVTAGPWTTSIARRVGVDLAAQPMRHQRVRTTCWPDLPTDHPVVRLPDLGSYVRPEGRSLICGHFESNPTAFDLESMPGEIHTADLDPPVELMRRARADVAEIYPQVGELDVAEYRRGLVTLAPDGSYVLGPAPGISDLYLASGCAALGIAGAPAVGRWLSEWILDGGPSDDVSEFSLGRFGDLPKDRVRLREEAMRAYATYYAIKD